MNEQTPGRSLRQVPVVVLVGVGCEFQVSVNFLGEFCISPDWLIVSCDTRREQIVRAS